MTIEEFMSTKVKKEKSVHVGLPLLLLNTQPQTHVETPVLPGF